STAGRLPAAGARPEFPRPGRAAVLFSSGNTASRRTGRRGAASRGSRSNRSRNRLLLLEPPVAAQPRLAQFRTARTRFVGATQPKPMTTGGVDVEFCGNVRLFES